MTEFLNFLARDIERAPERIKPLAAARIKRRVRSRKTLS